MFFQHVYDKSLAQASYFIGCQKEGVAVVIDAKRDVDTYLEIAKQNKMKITHIAETHIHADFLAGSRELAKLTGAAMYLSDEGGEGWQYEFPHVGLKDGSVIKVGNLTLKVMHTPGHTPESISFLLTDNPASKEPVMLFTGDFVFVGDVGRPDLLEKAAGFAGTKEAGAKEMYQSIAKFNALENGFVKYLLEDQPEPPKYFAMMKKLNKVDRPLLTEIPKLKKLSNAEFKAAFDKGIKLIDARNKVDFAAGFIPGGINIQGNNAFATWAGWFLKYDEPFMLVAAESQLEDLTRKLMRIGLDNIYGYIENVTPWIELGNTLEKSNVISLDEFKQLYANNNIQLVDVRGVSEFNAGHIKGATNIFVGTLGENLNQLKKDKQIVIQCQSGDRTAIAYSLLAKYGFKNVKNYGGGMNEWVNEGNPVVTEN